MAAILNLEHDAQAASRRLGEWIDQDPERLGGEPVFRGTRVPVKSLFDHLKAGDSLEVFLEDFPGVTPEQARAVLDLAGLHLLEEVQGR
jgi:uncharacterized protein (DUF433 family)